jgi:hypothetical protein
MSEYLDLPLRSLRDLAGETEAEIAAIEARQADIIEQKTVAELELRFADADQLGYQHDDLDDRRAALADRLETLEDEIAWREQPRFTGGAP